MGHAHGSAKNKYDLSLASKRREPGEMDAEGVEKKARMGMVDVQG